MTDESSSEDNGGLAGLQPLDLRIDPGRGGDLLRLAGNDSGLLVVASLKQMTVTHLDLESREVKALDLSQGVNPLFADLQCAAIQPEGRLCAAALGPMGFAVWEFGDHRFVRIEVPGPVTALAFSPDGSWLVVGTGLYSLHAGGVDARLYLFELPLRSSNAEPVRWIALPGCSVDALHWPWTWDPILAVTGFLDQQSGLAVRIAAPELRPLGFDLVPRAMASRAVGVSLSEDREDGLATISYREAVLGRDCGIQSGLGWTDPSCWRYETEGGNPAAAAWVERRGCWFMSDGWLVDRKGHRLERLNPLKDCVDVVATWKGCAGVASDGTVRYWPMQAL